MRVTVTQFSDATPQLEWDALVAHVRANPSDLVVLGEMPLGPWLAASEDVTAPAWLAAVEAHEEYVSRFSELGGAVVAGSRPVVRNGIPHNEGFLWSQEQAYAAAHTKYYLPNEPGFWEATWYRRAPTKRFVPAQLNGTAAGFMICTDMWFTEHARSYAKSGVDLLIVPRATEGRTAAKWLAGGRTAAVMAGAFCLSSNRQGVAHGVLFGGAGWIIDPNGDVLATTSDQHPFVTLDIDLADARNAKKSYPRYIEE